MPATVIVGAQWGDEGKGKIVDLLAQDADLVCRYQGGPNAGHTIIFDGETHKIRQIPTGILSGKVAVLGGGCVVDPEVLVAELDAYGDRGTFCLSGNAHLIMPWHVAIDQASERRLGKLQIGTTRRGIGPAYADKASRIGIRVQDLLDPKILRQKIEVALAEKNLWLERVYEAEHVRPRGRRGALRVVRQALAPARHRHVAARRRGAPRRQVGSVRGRTGDPARSGPRHVSIRHFVQSGCLGCGDGHRDRAESARRDHRRRQGVRHPRRRRALSERDRSAEQERLRELGGEFGTVTGRERRCGWLDLVALRYAMRLNGFTSLALTKLDVLSAFDEIPVCVRYVLPDGTETPNFPAHQSDFHHCRPVFETLEGWREPLGDELPEAAQAYVEFIERALDVPVSAGRDRRRARARARAVLSRPCAAADRALPPSAARTARDSS